jgi:hypothetical protein
LKNVSGINLHAHGHRGKILLPQDSLSPRIAILSISKKITLKIFEKYFLNFFNIDKIRILKRKRVWG